MKCKANKLIGYGILSPLVCLSCAALLTSNVHAENATTDITTDTTSIVANTTPSVDTNTAPNATTTAETGESADSSVTGETNTSTSTSDTIDVDSEENIENLDEFDSEDAEDYGDWGINIEEEKANLKNRVDDAENVRQTVAYQNASAESKKLYDDKIAAGKKILSDSTANVDTILGINWELSSAIRGLDGVLRQKAEAELKEKKAKLTELVNSGKELSKQSNNLGLSNIVVRAEQTLEKEKINLKEYDAQIAILTKTLEDIRQDQSNINLYPIVKQYDKDDSGKSFKLTPNTKLLAIEDTNSQLQETLNVIKLVQSELFNTTGTKVGVDTKQSVQATSSDVKISVTNSPVVSESNSLEAYKIVIDDNGVSVISGSPRGALYALRTVTRLASIYGNDLPYGTIIDYPDLESRRLHVDAGRKYFTKDWFIQKIKELSHLRINELQLHFSENSGFRIQSELYPQIMSEDGYLTKDEVREIIEAGKKYQVDIVPSFDTPGHMGHLLKFFPQYNQKGDNGKVANGGLDLTNREAIDFVKGLYNEYAELFKGSKYFAIGSDEYMEFDRAPFLTDYVGVLDRYAKQKFGSEYSWKDTIAAYINEIAELVHEKGFIPRIWNDGIYYGERKNNPQKIKIHDYVEVDFWSQMSWNRDIAKVPDILKRGNYKLNNFHSGYFYYVLRGGEQHDGRPAASFDRWNADEYIYSTWTPGKFSDNTLADDNPNIAGAGLSIWSDNAQKATEEQVSKDILNELHAFATKTWHYKISDRLTHVNFLNLALQYEKEMANLPNNPVPEDSSIDAPNTSNGEMFDKNNKVVVVSENKLSNDSKEKRLPVVNNDKTLPKTGTASSYGVFGLISLIFSWGIHRFKKDKSNM